MRLNLTEVTLDDGRRAGEGTLSQVLGDLEDLIDLGAGYIVLDTNPDHPSLRRPAKEDWAMLETVAAALSGD
jgi:hypothetical protein